ncbi:MAG: type III pantothenate kinase [candidate division WOR-3 bacterium]|nr:MAG: type III pantothenate kinase [candidate division WOR-3 bacterium]
MVGVVDIGNTNIHCGLYDGEVLRKKNTFPVVPHRITDGMKLFFATKELNGAAIASVVPRLTDRWITYFKKNCNFSPLIVSSKIDSHLTFRYYNPETLGADRIANVVGGLARYKRNVVVVDFGTATTLDAVLKDGTYLGGIITPGVGISLDVLSEKTALLKRVRLKRPESIIGRSTEECIQSGIFYGTVVMIRGFIHKIKKDMRKKFLCVATGGWGKMISPHIEEIREFDPDLALFGILKIYQYNV